MSGETIINTRIVCITPQMAEGMLRHNTGNRALRPSVVQHYADQMRRGKWQVTHQAIAVDCYGNLVDGQHRLSAIVMSGVSQMMLVSQYSGASDAMQLPVDRHLVRATHDILKIPRKNVEVASVMLGMSAPTYGRAQPVDKIGSVLSRHGGLISAVLDASPSKVRQRSSAAARAGVAIRCLASPTHMGEILAQYAAFVLMETTVAWNSIATLYRVFDRETNMIGAERVRMRVCKVFQAFDPDRKDATTRSGWCDKTFNKLRSVLEVNGIV